MRWITVVFIGLASAAGCVSDDARSPGDASDEGKKPAGAAYTHVVKAETEYYLSSPAQARPPDGTLREGTKVEVLQDSGSYARVRSDGGIEAYVATAALERLE